MKNIEKVEITKNRYYYVLTVRDENKEVNAFQIIETDKQLDKLKDDDYLMVLKSAGVYLKDSKYELFHDEIPTVWKKQFAFYLLADTRNNKEVFEISRDMFRLVEKNICNTVPLLKGQEMKKSACVEAINLVIYLLFY